MVPLGNKEVVEQWISEYVDSGLLKQIESSDRLDDQPLVEEGKLVDLRDIGKCRKLFLRAMGLPCEDGGEDLDESCINL